MSKEKNLQSKRPRKYLIFTKKILKLCQKILSRYCLNLMRPQSTFKFKNEHYKTKPCDKTELSNSITNFLTMPRLFW